MTEGPSPFAAQRTERLIGAAEYTLAVALDAPVPMVKHLVSQDPLVLFNVYYRKDTIGQWRVELQIVKSPQPVTFEFEVLTWAVLPSLADKTLEWPLPVTEPKFFRHFDERIAHSGRMVLLEDAKHGLSTPWRELARITIKMRVFVSSTLDGVRRMLHEARLAGSQCDLLLCAQGAELPAHRLVLTATSTVFERMLAGPFKEALDGRVLMDGVSKEALEKFLEHMYTDGVRDWAGLEVELLELSERYAMARLKRDCQLQLWLADAPRATSLLGQSLVQPLFGSALRRRWVRVVADDFPEVANSAEWKALRTGCPPLADAVLELSTHRATLVSTLDLDT